MFSPPRFTPMKWRSSKWLLAMLGAIGVRWRQKTNVTAPRLRSLLRVSKNGLRPPEAYADSIRAGVSIWSSSYVLSLQLLLLQRHSRSSRQTFCRPSRERECFGFCVSACVCGPCGRERIHEREKTCVDYFLGSPGCVCECALQHIRAWPYTFNGVLCQKTFLIVVAL